MTLPVEHPYRILILDDDQRMVRMICRQLEGAGFSTEGVSSPDELWRSLESEPPDLLLLDLILPGANEDGYSIAAKVRATSNLPIIMLSGKGLAMDKVVGLKVGADDYLVKPFDEQELIARIHALLRRSATCQPNPRKVSSRQADLAKFEDWRVDFLAYQVTGKEGDDAELTSHEFALLAELVRHPGRTLSRDALSEAVSGQAWSPDNRSIDGMIAKIRKKLAMNDRGKDCIVTVRGVGYRFGCPVEFIKHQE